MSHLLVIGGTSGIGKTIVGLSGKFNRVTVPTIGELNVRLPEQINQYIKELSLPVTHTMYCAGVASLQWIGNLCSDSLSDFNGRDDFEEVFDVNVFGFMRVLSVLTNTFDSGRVLALVSDAARVPMRGSMAYCSSKAALAMAIRVAARELAPNWSVNGLAPSAVVDTPMTDYIDEMVPQFRGWTSTHAWEYEISNNPMGRRVTKPEVAQVALDILLGTEFLTGETIYLSGGR